MKHLFICATPSHLVNTINIVLTKYTDDEITLYILDHSDNHKELYQKALTCSKDYIKHHIGSSKKYVMVLEKYL